MTITVGDITLRAYSCAICGMRASDKWLAELCERRHIFMREKLAGHMKTVLKPRGGYHKVYWQAGRMCVDCHDRPAAVRKLCQRCYQRHKAHAVGGL